MPATAEERRGRIEKLLAEIRAGNDEARETLFEVVYGDLRRMAENLMVNERQGHTLQPTALVHEAYMKIFVGAPLRAWDRAYLFAAQARAMRQILIEHARRRGAAKRPDNRARTPLDNILDAFESSQRVAMIDLDEALEELRGADQRHYEVVTLRFFGGLGWKEISDHLGVSVSTVEKDWQASRAWLYSRLRSNP